jgi:hypothetical protein
MMPANRSMNTTSDSGREPPLTRRTTHARRTALGWTSFKIGPPGQSSARRATHMAADFRSLILERRGGVPAPAPRQLGERRPKTRPDNYWPCLLIKRFNRTM